MTKSTIKALGLLDVARTVSTHVVPSRRSKWAAERRVLDSYREILQTLGTQLSTRMTSARGAVLINRTDGVRVALFEAPVIAAIVASGYEPVVILNSPSQQLDRQAFEMMGVRHFEYWEGHACCPSEQQVIADFEALKDFRQSMHITWKGVPVGKYALSTLMRRVRACAFDMETKDHCDAMRESLSRTLSHTMAALEILDKWTPDHVIFIDRGYTPEGPMFSLCMERGIDSIALHTAHRDNTLALKRYHRENQDRHPYALSTSSWEQLCALNWTENHWITVRDELEYCYRSGKWYSEVGTQFNKKLLDGDALKESLGLDPKKKTVLVFAHIFWDATFFWGEDVFADYEDWFRTVVAHAWTDPSVNWVIKVHPANLVKNHRDGVTDELAEVKVIKEFGEVPDHIHILPVDTDLSTWSLFQIAEVCLTVRGTVGIEAATLGLTVVTAGTGRYDRHGFTIDPETPEDYLKTLKSLSTLPAPSEESITLARRFAYGTFISRAMDVKSTRFEFRQDDVATLDIGLTETARKNIFDCPDVKLLVTWLQSDQEDLIGQPILTGSEPHRADPSVS